MFLISLKLKIYMKKLFKIILERFNLFLIATKLKKMCKKVVGYYHHTLEYVSDYYMTQEICKKAVDTNSKDARKSC